MKTVLKVIKSFFKSMAQARGASALARAGYFEKAKQLYQKEKI